MTVSDYVISVDGESIAASSTHSITAHPNNHAPNAGRTRDRVAQGRHRKPHVVIKAASLHYRRLLSFSLIGFGVFAAGLVFQVCLVRVFHVVKVEAYVIQLTLSVQVNFLANYRWTWGDRESPFWQSFWRYNLKRLAGTVLNLLLYPLLIHLGMDYIFANVLLVVILTPANYVLGDLWTFAASKNDT